MAARSAGWDGGQMSPSETLLGPLVSLWKADPSWAKLLQRQHADGKLSEPEFQQKKEDLRAWGANPAAENDPAVHRGRLEQRRAAGAVTDAEYAQRSAELDAWEKGLAQVRSGA